MQAAFVPGEQFVGKTLGKYSIRQYIGKGQLRAVYRARQLSQDQSVLLMMFLMPEKFSMPARERFIGRFQQEGRRLVQLTHPHILPTLDMGVEEGYPYLVLPLSSGTSLTQLIKQRGRFAPEQALDIIRSVAGALDKAHEQGIVHGALSPEQILIDKENKVYVTGFGFNRLTGLQGIELNANLSHAYLRDLAGEPLPGLDYTAPEIVQGVAPDARADVYSVGMILLEMLSGSLPAGVPDPIERAIQRSKKRVVELVSLPAGLDLIMQQALENEPRQRLQSVGKLSRTIERALGIFAASLPEKQTMPHIAAAAEPNLNWAFDPTLKPTSQIASSSLLGNQSAPHSTAGDRQVKQNALASTAFLSSDAALVPPQSANAQAAPQHWTPTAPPFGVGGAAPMRTPIRPGSQPKKPPSPAGRRKAVLLATGGVVGVLGLGGLGLAQLLLHPAQKGNQGPTGQTGTTLGATATVPQNMATPTTTVKPSPTAQASPVATSQPITTAPQPPPAPPANTTLPPLPPGTTTAPPQGMNTARDFVNPVDNARSIVIRLANGNYVAFEKQCTHNGSTEIVYNPATGLLRCPLHGSVYNPAQSGEVVTSATTIVPLAPVPVQVNQDGTLKLG